MQILFFKANYFKINKRSKDIAATLYKLSKFSNYLPKDRDFLIQLVLMYQYSYVEKSCEKGNITYCFESTCYKNIYKQSKSFYPIQTAYCLGERGE